MTQATSAARDRADRCPGISRPWIAEDGLLVRLRLIGGRITSDQLVGLAAIANRYGDGQVQLTARANLQLRALPGSGGVLDRDVVTALAATGLLPSRTHELIRNVMVSPQTGLAGGRADLRGVAEELDDLLCADPVLVDLPGRFLFVLDDGRGDLLSRTSDLGFVSLDNQTVQLRVGVNWGPVVDLLDAAHAIVELARSFCAARGDGPTAAWHVAELTMPLVPVELVDPRVPPATDLLPFGPVPGGQHHQIPNGLLDRAAVTALTRNDTDLVVTPWRGVLIPEATR
jgi:precorrin-3B synthase